MVSVDRQTWDALFEKLRTRYLESLPARLDALETTLGHIEKDPDDDTLRERLTLQAHKMAGSGKTYGFDRISVCARQLEDALRTSSASLEESTRLADVLILECRKVIHDSTSQPI